MLYSLGFRRHIRGMKVCTDLKGIFPVNMIIHRQHGYVKAWQKNASKYSFLFFICTETGGKKDQQLFWLVKFCVLTT